MVTGERLFPGDSEMSVLEAVRQGKTRPPRHLDPSVPREVDEIVLRALAVEPQDRFQSAAEMKHRLGTAIAAIAPAVGPTDLAAYIRQVFEPEAGESLEAAAAPVPPAPVSPSWAAEPATATPVAAAAAEPEPVVEAVAPLVAVPVEEEGGRKGRTLLYAAIAALIVVAVATYFVLNRSRQTAPSPAPAEASAGTPAAPRQAGATAPIQTVPPGAGGAQRQGPAAMPADLKAIVDKQLAEKENELRRRNEEKLKELENQLAAAKTASQPPPAAQVPQVPPAAEAPAAPVETAPSLPAPEPQREPEPPKAEAPAAAEPPPPAREPEPPRVKAGDLAEPGAGAVPPQLVSFPKPEYPPMARKLRVEGVVVVSVLVDENGQVQEARIAEPIRQKVGLNEAALASARSARFRPATKDGVRVKMWTRLRIPFKL